MNQPANSPAGSAPIDSTKREIDELCRSFESDWQGGQPRPIEDYVSPLAETLRPIATAKLIAREVELRISAGDWPGKQEYIKRFPAFRSVLENLLGVDDTAPETVSGINIRCPHCHQINYAGDETLLSEMVCLECQTAFRLVADTLGELTPTEKSFGHFALIARLGAGAFGEVWKARDTELDRMVAVKVPRKGQLSAEEAEKFLRDARAAAQLSHPNIVSVHEVGQHDNVIYIVSDFIEGTDLSEWLEGQKFTFREAIGLCYKITQALSHAHKMGVIHRDLKPGNIMLDGSQEPHLIDFGLAKREAVDITMTAEGRILGTPAYMAPEQAKGTAQDTDARTDLYSMGVVMFELLTGERPFRGNVRMLIEQVINEEPPSPRKFVGTLPRDLETICLKLLEKHPERRYQSADDLGDDLRRWLANEPISARPISRWERGLRWCQRNPIVASLTALVTVLVITVMVSGYVYTVDLQQEQLNTLQALAAADESQKLAHREAQRAQLEETRARQSAEEVTRQLYVNRISMAESEWRANDPVDFQHALRQCPPKLRRWEWHYLNQLAHQELAVFTNYGVPIRCVATNSEGQIAVSGGNDMVVSSWYPADGNPAHAFEGHIWDITAVAFDDAGESIASGSVDKTVRIWNTATGELSRELGGFFGEIAAVEFRAATGDDVGKQLFVATANRSLDNGDITLYNVATGEDIVMFDEHPGAVNDVTGSPDGKWAVSVGTHGEIKAWSVDEAEERWTVAAHDGEILAVDIDHAGNRVATAGADGMAHIRDASNGASLITLRGHMSPVLDVAFSFDDSRAATAGEDGTVRLWDLSTGRQEFILRGHTGPITGLAFLKDNRLISTSLDGTARVWNITDRPEAKKLVTHTGAVRSVAFSPDSHWLASVGVDSVIRISGVTSREVIAEYKAHSGAISTVVFNPTGDKIVTGGVDATIQIRNVNSGELVREFPGNSSDIQHLSFNRAGDTLASAASDGTVSLWKIYSEQEQPKSILRGHTREVTAVEFHPTIERVASVGRDGFLRMWDETTGELQSSIDCQQGLVFDVAWSPAGDRIATAGNDHTIRLWNPSDGKLVQTLRGHSGHVWCVAFNRQGDRILSGSWDKTMRIWDASSGSVLLTMQAHSQEVLAAEFSPDGRRIVSAGNDGQVLLWNSR